MQRAAELEGLQQTSMSGKNYRKVKTFVKACYFVDAYGRYLSAGCIARQVLLYPVRMQLQMMVCLLMRCSKCISEGCMHRSGINP